jgi:hypothetical protein
MRARHAPPCARGVREACALAPPAPACSARLALPALRPPGSRPRACRHAVGWRCSARYMGLGDAALSKVRHHCSLFPSQDDPVQDKGQICIDKDSALIAPFVSDTVNLLIAPQEHTHQRPLSSFLLGPSTEEIQSVALCVPTEMVR